MSFVTGIMLLVGASDWEESPIEEVQAWLAERNPSWRLLEVSDYTGGNKHPQFNAWSAGINFFDDDEFADFVMSRDWLGPQNVVLVLQPEDGPTRVYVPQNKFGETPTLNVIETGSASLGPSER